MDREDLVAALDRHATDTADATALALRAGAAFKMLSKNGVRAIECFDVWAWRAEWMAMDGVVTCKDFEQGLPALRRAGDERVALAVVDTAEGKHLVFLTLDLSSCVAVL